MLLAAGADKEAKGPVSGCTKAFRAVVSTCALLMFKRLGRTSGKLVHASTWRHALNPIRPSLVPTFPQDGRTPLSAAAAAGNMSVVQVGGAGACSKRRNKWLICSTGNQTSRSCVSFTTRSNA